MTTAKTAIKEAGALGVVIIIKYDADWNEYKVPTSEDTFYHTDDRQDAIDTARAIYGKGAIIKVRGGANA